MALSLTVTAFTRPPKPTISNAGEFTGHVLSPPILIQGVITDGRGHRVVTIECDDATSKSEFSAGLGTSSLNSWLQSWVNANLDDGFGKLGDVYTDTTNLSAAQQSYVGTTLTPSA